MKTQSFRHLVESVKGSWHKSQAPIQEVSFDELPQDEKKFLRANHNWLSEWGL